MVSQLQLLHNELVLTHFVIQKHNGQTKKTNSKLFRLIAVCEVSTYQIWHEILHMVLPLCGTKKSEGNALYH